MGRGLALATLGLWLGALVASWVAATVNFRTVDRVLGPAQRAELAERLAPLPAAERRSVLRHLASEINRFVFRWFSPAQLVLAAVALGLGWRSGGGRGAVAAAAALTLVQLALSGPIVELGRSIDFVPRPLPPDVARRFGQLHAAYVLADLAKAGLLCAAVWLLARQPTP